MKNYLILSVVSDDDNAAHEDMIMKHCCILDGTVGRRAKLLVDVGDEKYGWHTFLTSDLQEITYYPDGDVVMVTENSTYRLLPFDGGPDEHYNPRVAQDAQKKYCAEHHYPVLVGSHCYRCGKSLYMNGNNAISIERAGSSLIAGCPYCHYSFCD